MPLVSLALARRFQNTNNGLAVKEHLDAKRTYEMSAHATGAAQGLLMTVGLLATLFLGVYQVTVEKQTVGRFTTLLIYWAQLQSEKIKSFSFSILTVYRSIAILQQHLQKRILQSHGRRASFGVVPDKAYRHRPS